MGHVAEKVAVPIHKTWRSKCVLKNIFHFCCLSLGEPLNYKHRILKEETFVRFSTSYYLMSFNDDVYFLKNMCIFNDFRGKGRYKKNQ